MKHELTSLFQIRVGISETFVNIFKTFMKRIDLNLQNFVQHSSVVTTKLITKSRKVLAIMAKVREI